MSPPPITRDAFLDELLAQRRAAWPNNPRLAIDYTEAARAAIEGAASVSFPIGAHEQQAWRQLGGQGRLSLTRLRALPVTEAPCLVAMGTVCYGHARGAPANMACNTREDAPYYKNGARVEVRPTLRFLEQSLHLCPDIELGKRQHFPYVVTSSCPKCQRVLELDLSRGPHYLAYPSLGEVEDVQFRCDLDDLEWQVKVRVDLSLTLVEA